MKNKKVSLRVAEFSLFALKCVYLKKCSSWSEQRDQEFHFGTSLILFVTTYISVFLHVLLSWNQSLCMKSTIMTRVYNRLTGLIENRVITGMLLLLLPKVQNVPNKHEAKQRLQLTT